MELLLAIPIVLVSVAALAAGLLLRGKPLQTSCHGMACLNDSACEGCPKRRQGKAATDE